jgi:Fe2+ transport system protein B
VDKSVTFNTLTKRYVSVSNYPGTTVEVMRGKAGLSLVLDLNFMDEAQKLRVKIDLSGFEAKIDIPVVVAIATEEREMNLLKKRRTYA